jgi:5'-nucleotidase
MRILITNDDGINSPGLQALERVARTLSDDIWVVAPELDQSGLSHSLSLSDPLRLRKVGEKHYAVRGTPSDCVIMAVRRLLADKKPDLILSGINSGANMAEDVTYSGTVAGAIEGTMLGVKSIAVSQAYTYHDDQRVVPWETAEARGPEIIRKLLDFGFPDGVFYNLNFPNCAPDDVRGIAVTRQGKLAHALHIDERRDGRNLPYYWLVYRRAPTAAGPGSDVEAVEKNVISLTPLRIDMTADEIRSSLSDFIVNGSGGSL